MNTRFIPIVPFDLVYYLETSTRTACKQCKRYTLSGSCPPYLEDLIYYQESFISFPLGIVIMKKFIIDNPENWKELGRQSSEDIRKELNNFVNYLKPKRYEMFGAGSCKHCEKCNVPCKFPDKRLIPIEGTGLNVVKLIKDIANLELKFPVEPQGYFYRIGLLIYEI